MPEIPQYQANKPIASLPSAVLDRERRPRMDSSGAINAVARVADAARGTDVSQHLSELGPEAFGGQSARAAGAIAQGVQQIGNLFATVHERKLEAQNDYDMAEAQSFLDQQYADFEKWKMEKAPGSPEQWEKEWDRRKPGIMGSLQERQYSQFVKDRLNPYATRWEGQTSIRVATDATKATFARTGQMFADRRELMWQQGNIEGAKAINAEMVVKGYTTQDSANLDVFTGTQQVMHKEQQTKLDELIFNNPREAASLLSQDGTLPELNLTGEQRYRAIGMAERIVSEQQRDRVNYIQNGMVTGTIKSADDIDIEGAGALEPVVIEQLKEQLAGRAPKNTDKFWNEASSIIDSFDTSGDQDEWQKNAVDMETAISLNTTPGPMRDALNERLKSRIDSTFNEPIVAKKKTAGALLDIADKSGAFGQREKESDSLAKKEIQYLIPKTTGMLWWKRPGTVEDAEKKETFIPMRIPDTELEAEADRRKREVRAQVETWIDENPSATESEIQEKINEFTGIGQGASDADTFLNLDNSLFGTRPDPKDLRKMINQ
jgi:hypothetical protein